MVNTKQAPRREVSFGSLDELKAELDRIDAAHAAGNLGHTGNWTPAENLDHLAVFWGYSLDGFPGMRVPLAMRIVARLLFKKHAVAGKQPPPGFQIPKSASHFLPREGVTYEQASQALHACIERVQRGDSFVPASPIFGKLSNEQWTNLHLGHCGMHLSFIDIPSGNE